MECITSETKQLDGPEGLQENHNLDSGGGGWGNQYLLDGRKAWENRHQCENAV